MLRLRFQQPERLHTGPCGGEGEEAALVPLLPTQPSHHVEVAWYGFLEQARAGYRRRRIRGVGLINADRGATHTHRRVIRWSLSMDLDPGFRIGRRFVFGARHAGMREPERVSEAYLGRP